MTTYTLNDLIYAKGTSEPVHQMLLAMAEKIERLEAKREWQGLTDEEISELIRATNNTGSFVRAIEAKLKEKNGYQNG